MTRSQLIGEIRRKSSLLCVGLDTDIDKIPKHLLKEENPVLAFNKAIIDATKDYTVSYKINTAFYEAAGPKGWQTLAGTLAYLPENVLAIADAKRGDIGNTADQYARTFFKTYPFHAVTVAPYMGADSIKPFLAYAEKWTILLALTSNAGSADFQKLVLQSGAPLFEEVLKTSSSWGTPENTMYVIGATRAAEMSRIREIVPDHFLLVPGVGAQGGDLGEVCRMLLHPTDAAILVNASRAVIYAADGEGFADAAGEAASAYAKKMAGYLKRFVIP